MKFIIRAALLAVSIGSIGTAYAGEGPIANTQFNQLPGVIAQVQVQDNRAFAATQSGSGAALFVTHQQSNSVFPWNQNEGVGG